MDDTGRCLIKANPDVSGVGIRVSLYVLCVGGRIGNFVVEKYANKDKSEEFVRSTNAALSVQGLALLCTAIVQTGLGQLTLFHAIVVLHLLALLGINLASRGNYRGNEVSRFLMDGGLMALAAMAFIGFHIYVWVNAEHFGPDDGCNSETVYVVFGVSVHATAPVFRYIILATFAIIPVVFIIFLVLTLPCLWLSWRHSKPLKGSTGGCLGCGLRRKLSDASSAAAPAPANNAASGLSSNAESDKRITEKTQAVGYVAFSIYCIVSLEQMIQRNNVGKEEREWTFGQIIALFLLVGSIYEGLALWASTRGPQPKGQTGQPKGQTEQPKGQTEQPQVRTDSEGVRRQNEDADKNPRGRPDSEEVRRQNENADKNPQG